MMPISKKKGFTLIETLVAISIMTIAIVGPMTTASRALLAAYTARDQLSASYLAQEGTEYVRLMRDTMYLANYAAYPSDSRLGLDSFCNFADPNPGTDCNVTSPSSASSIAACVGAGDGTTKCALADPLATMGVGANKSVALCGATCPVLYLSGGRYTTTVAGTATPFTRTIKLYGWDPNGTNSLGNELQVTVIVSWKEHAIPYTATVVDYLSPWQ